MGVAPCGVVSVGGFVRAVGGGVGGIVVGTIVVGDAVNCRDALARVACTRIAISIISCPTIISCCSSSMSDCIAVANNLPTHSLYPCSSISWRLVTVSRRCP